MKPAPAFGSRLLRAWLASAVGLLGGAAALAQEASVDALVQRAQAVLAQIDAGEVATVWEAAAPALKTRVPREELVETFRKSRQGYGRVTQRSLASVTREQYADESRGIPPGSYTTTNFIATVEGGGTVPERVSFRQEADGSWKFVGFVPNPPKP